MRQRRGSITTLCAVLLLAAFVAGPVRAQHDHEHTAGDGHDHGHDSGFELLSERPWAWSKSALELAETLPVQDGGRVKPLSTYASFTLLRLSGKRSIATPSGEKLSATAWLLDLLVFPDVCASYPVFLVENPEVLEAIGLEPKDERARYAYTELATGIERLMTLAHEYAPIPDAERSPLQGQVLILASNVRAFEALGTLAELALFPPTDAAQETWTTPGEAIARLQRGQPVDEPALYAAFQALIVNREDRPAAERGLAALHAGTVGLAERRGEYGKIGLEVAYYDLKPLTWSHGAFLLAFLAVAFLWLSPRSWVLHGLAFVLASAGTLALVTTIVWRCMIRSLPPVTNLYETLLFVTATGALIALVVEGIGRRRLALSAAAVLGVVGIFLADRFEMIDKADTMPSLVAVLRTNFWLSTHVTCITLGYAAGILAALLGSIYLVCTTFGLKREDRDFYKTVSRMTYGVLCFGVLASTVGTILGGIWANVSWGRFWGWDPKENGALLIVLTQIAILHGRMGGYLREHGVCAAAALGGTVVAFSWFGTNLLGVGLHSYGFTNGIATALWTYYGIQWGIVGMGGIAWLLARAKARETEARLAAEAAGPWGPENADPAGVSATSV